jgi:hypothetical protein
MPANDRQQSQGRIVADILLNIKAARPKVVDLARLKIEE